MKTLSRTRKPRGFTLVEVLVALAIMAVLAGLAWRGLDTIVRGRDVSRERVDATLRAGTVLAQWEQDLQSLFESASVPALAIDGGSARMVRRADDGVQVVVWSLHDGRLLRWAAPVTTSVGSLQESWLRSQQLLGNESGQLLMLDGVAGWRHECFVASSNAWVNCQSDLQGPAPSSQQQQQQQQPQAAQQRSATPAGVRMDLTLAAGTLVRIALLAPSPRP